MRALTIAIRAALAAVLLCTAVAVWRVGAALAALPARADAALEREAERTRAALLEAVANTRAALVAEMAEARRELIAEVRGLRQQAQTEVASTRAVLDQRLASIEARADGRLEGAQAEVEALSHAVTRTLAGADRVTERASRMIELLTPQALGLVAASKVTAGELAQTARTWRRETPEIAANVKETTKNVAAATRLSKWQKVLLVLGAGAAAVAAAR